MYKLGVKFYIKDELIRLQVWYQDESLPSGRTIISSMENGTRFKIMSMNTPALAMETLYIRGCMDWYNFRIDTSFTEESDSGVPHMRLIDKLNGGVNKVRILEV